ncbi:MAG: hypothetical protein LCH83_01095 [Proteobacteria bacterium]|nr:hypothetical protein [Pseudomonadota bacterium]
MAKRSGKLEGISAVKGGELWFTIESTGRGEFHLRLTKAGQFYLLQSVNGELPHKWNDSDILRALFELIETPMYKAEFYCNHYSGFSDNDIPF